MNRTYIDHKIIRTVQKLQRSYERIYPWMLTAHIDLMRSEASYRRDMSRLARQGVLIRVDGADARKGYRVGTPHRGSVKPPPSLYSAKTHQHTQH